MLVCTVEVWPGGSPLRKKIVGTLTLANVSELDEISDYEGHLVTYQGWSVDEQDIEVLGHNRSDGAWELVRKALDGPGQET